MLTELFVEDIVDPRDKCGYEAVDLAAQRVKATRAT
jgi:hypothetical protein